MEFINSSFFIYFSLKVLFIKAFDAGKIHLSFIEPKDANAHAK